MIEGMDRFKKTTERKGIFSAVSISVVSVSFSKKKDILMKNIFFAMLFSSSLLCADPLESTLPIMPLQTDLQLPTPHFQPPPYKSPFLAVGLSVIFPGLGHVYLGDMQTAGGLIGSAGLGLGLATSHPSSRSVRKESGSTVMDISFYGIYAAYRDVRKYNENSGYSYKMPNDSLGDLSYAPFK